MNSPQSQSPPRFPVVWLLALACLGLGVINKNVGMVGIGLIGLACGLWTILAYLHNLWFWWRRRPRPRGYWIYLTLVWAFLVCVSFYWMLVMLERRGIRVRIGRCRGDMQTTALALDEFYRQHKTYPEWSLDCKENVFGYFGYLSDTYSSLIKQPSFVMPRGTQRLTLTTPVAYIKSYFSDFAWHNKGVPFCYWATTSENTSQTAPGYILWSAGPDAVYDLTIDNVAKAYDPASTVPSTLLLNLTYDPSNGIRSGGDVYRYKQSGEK